MGEPRKRKGPTLPRFPRILPPYLAVGSRICRGHGRAVAGNHLPPTVHGTEDPGPFLLSHENHHFRDRNLGPAVEREVEARVLVSEGEDVPIEGDGPGPGRAGGLHWSR